jgi:hypothetical protein
MPNPNVEVAVVEVEKMWSMVSPELVAKRAAVPPEE